MNPTYQDEQSIEQPIHIALERIARVLGYLLHPVLIIVWVSLHLLFANDQVFVGMKNSERTVLFLRLFSTSVFLPLVTVLLLKALGFISSSRLQTQKERIIPLVACITFFFWSYYVSRQLQDPPEWRAFLLALFLCASSALLMNIYQKTSLHMQAAGTVVTFYLLLLFSHSLNDRFSLAIVILLTGLSGTGRLLSGSHRSTEVWTGFFSGILIQMIAWWIVV